ncbi:MAG: hypothetical protein ACO3ZW_00705 [Opitutales bacterium]|jgi:hypothetical protein
MKHHHTWTESLTNFAKRAGEKLPDLLRSDLTETRYGHRILDQIFREGKFAPKKKNRKSRTPKADINP